jgi:Reverse transcriptase (RNA-dependent DNA polymerase)
MAPDNTDSYTYKAALDIHPRLLKWMHSFLSNRQQRVKIRNVFSDWISLKGGMPQGTWLGPYVFLILINDLNTIMASFKFVDDVTLTEIINLIGHQFHAARSRPSS